MGRVWRRISTKQRSIMVVVRSFSHSAWEKPKVQQIGLALLQAFDPAGGRRPAGYGTPPIRQEYGPRSPPLLYTKTSSPQIYLSGQKQELVHRFEVRAHRPPTEQPVA